MIILFIDYQPNGDNGLIKMILYLCALFGLAYWVYKDAKSKGIENPEGWFLGCLFFSFIAIPMYLFKRATYKMKTDEDSALLQAEPISRKRMDLLWLDPPRLAQLQQPLAQHKVITVAMGDSSNLRDHEITQEDFEWAKQIEQIVDKAYSAGQRGDYEEAIHHYKKALELAPGCDLFLMSIGAGYAHLGQKTKAIQYLERAVQISPGNSRIRDSLDNARRMTTSSGSEPSQPAVAPSIGKKQSKVNRDAATSASTRADQQCEHEWVRVMEKVDNLTLKFSTKCKKCGATMPQETKRIDV